MTEQCLLTGPISDVGREFLELGKNGFTIIPGTVAVTCTPDGQVILILAVEKRTTTEEVK